MNIEMLLTVVLYVVIIGAICGLLWWLIGFLGIPEPFGRVARGVVAVVGVVLLVLLMLQFLPSMPLKR